MVRSLTWLLFSLFFGVLSPFTLLYKATTKLYNENGKNGGDGEFLIITDNYYRQLTFHILRISHEHDAHNSSLYRARARAMIMMATHSSKPMQLADSRVGR